MCIYKSIPACYSLFPNKLSWHETPPLNSTSFCKLLERFLGSPNRALSMSIHINSQSTLDSWIGACLAKKSCNDNDSSCSEILAVRDGLLGCILASAVTALAVKTKPLGAEIPREVRWRFGKKHAKCLSHFVSALLKAAAIVHSKQTWWYILSMKATPQQGMIDGIDRWIICHLWIWALRKGGLIDHWKMSKSRISCKNHVWVEMGPWKSFLLPW